MVSRIFALIVIILLINLPLSVHSNKYTIQEYWEEIQTATYSFQYTNDTVTSDRIRDFFDIEFTSVDEQGMWFEIIAENHKDIIVDHLMLPEIYNVNKISGLRNGKYAYVYTDQSNTDGNISIMPTVSPLFAKDFNESNSDLPYVRENNTKYEIIILNGKSVNVDSYKIRLIEPGQFVYQKTDDNYTLSEYILVEYIVSAEGLLLDYHRVHEYWNQTEDGNFLIGKDQFTTDIALIAGYPGVLVLSLEDKLLIFFGILIPILIILRKYRRNQKLNEKSFID